MTNEIIIGSVERYGVTMQQGDVSLNDCRWQIVIAAQRTEIIPKEQCIYIDDNTYDFIVDTEKLGLGSITARLEIDIEDNNVASGYRHVIIRLPINDKIVR